MTIMLFIDDGDEHDDHFHYLFWLSYYDDSGDKVDIHDDDHAHPLQMTRVDRAPHQSRAWRGKKGV